jgi:hypothetical protein
MDLERRSITVEGARGYSVRGWVARIWSEAARVENEGPDEAGEKCIGGECQSIAVEVGPLTVR